MTRAGALLLALLAASGCGRRWEQFWGQDTRREPRYIALVPDAVEADIIGDLFWVMDSRFLKARYLCVYAVDGAGVKLALPYYDPKTGKTAAALVDGNRIAFVNLKTALPGAVRVRVEFVL